MDELNFWFANSLMIGEQLRNLNESLLTINPCGHTDASISEVSLSSCSREVRRTVCDVDAFNEDLSSPEIWTLGMEKMMFSLINQYI